MTLVPDPGTKGLWLSTERRKAGAHAVVIGVSDYPYLSGGNAPELAPDSGGLSQLEVSAKTAAKVFDWLRHANEVAGAPIATCRLLLSPRSDENAEVEELTSGAYAPADFGSVRSAIEDWGSDIFAGAAEPGANVAFFFFSGHGTEHMASPALLTKDILNPRSPGGARKAVAFLPLCQAMKTFGIDRGLFFVDACRDVPGVARTLNIVGEDILRPYAYPPRNHDALLCLQSTRVGGSAYQVPGDPATIFGQAVLEALEGPPPSYRPYDTTAVPWRLVFRELESYVKQRVRELLARQTAALIQSVVPYGDPYDSDMLVALKEGPQPGGAEASEPAITISPTSSIESVIATRSDELLKGFAQGLDVAAVTSAVTRHGAGFTREIFEPSIMHGIFGHEGITDPWVRSLRVLDVDTEQPVPEAVRLAKGRSQQVGATLTSWVDVLVAPALGSAVWIGAGGENDSPSFAVVIPRDLRVATPVRLDVSFELKDTGAWIMTSMSARLHDPAELPADVRQVWTTLWEAQRTETLSDLGHAGLVLVRDREALEATLATKQDSPVAAAIAAIMLIRCGALEQLHDWPRNLANLFPGLPDGAVLWAETLMRRHDLAVRAHVPPDPHVNAPGKQPALRDDPAEIRRLAAEPTYDEARRYFAMLAERGPPLLAGTLTMAVQQERFFRHVVDIKAVTGPAQHDLQDACEVVRRAAEYAVAHGLFAAFVSHSGLLTPHAALGAPKRKLKAA